MGLQSDSGHMELFHVVPYGRHESGFRLLKGPYPHHGGHTVNPFGCGLGVAAGEPGIPGSAEHGLRAGL